MFYSRSTGGEDGSYAQWTALYTVVITSLLKLATLARHRSCSSSYRFSICNIIRLMHYTFSAKNDDAMFTIFKIPMVLTAYYRLLNDFSRHMKMNTRFRLMKYNYIYEHLQIQYRLKVLGYYFSCFFASMSYMTY